MSSEVKTNKIEEATKQKIRQYLSSIKALMQE